MDDLRHGAAVPANMLVLLMSQPILKRVQNIFKVLIKLFLESIYTGQHQWICMQVHGTWALAYQFVLIHFQSKGVFLACQTISKR